MNESQTRDRVHGRSPPGVILSSFTTGRLREGALLCTCLRCQYLFIFRWQCRTTLYFKKRIPPNHQR